MQQAPQRQRKKYRTVSRKQFAALENLQGRRLQSRCLQRHRRLQWTHLESDSAEF